MCGSDRGQRSWLDPEGPLREALRDWFQLVLEERAGVTPDNSQAPAEILARLRAAWVFLGDPIATAVYHDEARVIERETGRCFVCTQPGASHRAGAST